VTDAFHRLRQTPIPPAARQFLTVYASAVAVLLTFLA